MATFSENLKYLRKREGLTQTQLAKNAGIGRSAISMYELGKREPDFETLEMLADYFNVDMDFLTGRSDMELIRTSDENFVPVFADIAAGTPRVMDNTIEGHIYIKQKGAEHFALRVHGDSMDLDRINDGDIVVVRCQDEVSSNEIAVVRVDGERATVKRIKLQDDTAILMPHSSNAENQPQIYNLKEHSIQIIGKVIEVRFDI